MVTACAPGAARAWRDICHVVAALWRTACHMPERVYAATDSAYREDDYD